MNEDQFRLMLDALIDGLWYDDTIAGLSPYEKTSERILSHIATGVRGTPAEAWLNAWSKNKPPTHESLDETGD